MISRAPDPRVAERLEALITLQQASLKWHWRTLAIIVSVATIASAVVQVLNYMTH